MLLKICRRTVFIVLIYQDFGNIELIVYDMEKSISICMEFTIVLRKSGLFGSALSKGKCIV